LTARVSHQDILDLGRGDILPAPDDRVVGAALDEQVALVIEPATVTRREQPSASSMLPSPTYSPETWAPRTQTSPATFRPQHLAVLAADRQLDAGHCLTG